MNKFLSLVTAVAILSQPFASLNAAEKSSGKSKAKQQSKPKSVNRITGTKGVLNDSKPSLVSVDALSLQNYQDDKDNFDIDNYDKVTLKSVILETLSLSNTLKSNKEKLKQVEYELKKKYADYYPSVDLEYSTKRTKNKTGDTEVDTASHIKYDDESYKLSISQSIYSGGETESEIEQAKYKVQEAKRKYKIALDKEIQKAIKAYFDVLYNHQKLKANEKNQLELNKILDITQVKYDSGALSIGDLSAVKAQLANAESTLITVKSDLADSLDYYLYIVGEDFKRTAPFEEEFGITISTLDSLYEEVENNNLNLLNYRVNIKALKETLAGEKANFRPTVDFEMNYKNVLDKEGFELNEETVDAKLTFSYNIYNGGKDTIESMKIFSSLQDLKYAYAEEVKKIKWEVSKLYNSITSLDGTVKSTKEEVSASNEMVGAYWEGFQLGEQDLQVLLQGQRQLNTAELNLIQYKQDYLENIFKLEYERGSLSEYFDIDPNDPYFLDFSKSGKIKRVTEIDLSDSAPNLSDLNKTVDEYLDVPEAATYDNLVNFKDQFLESEDNKYTLVIDGFKNNYDSYNFIKRNRLLENAFMYGYFENDGTEVDAKTKEKYFNIANKVAYGIYENEEEANGAQTNIYDPNANVNYTVALVSDVKEEYRKYMDGLEATIEPYKIKPKVIKTFVTDQEFKQQFLSAPEYFYSINVISVTNFKHADKLIRAENIKKDSFVFKYGRNGEWVKIMYGVFPTYTQAKEALASKTNLVDMYGPVIEKISLKQELYDKYKQFNKLPKWYIDEQKEIERKAAEERAAALAAQEEIELDIDPADIEDIEVSPETPELLTTMEQNITEVPLEDTNDTIIVPVETNISSEVNNSVLENNVSVELNETIESNTTTLFDKLDENISETKLDDTPEYNVTAEINTTTELIEENNISKEINESIEPVVTPEVNISKEPVSQPKIVESNITDAVDEVNKSVNTEVDINISDDVVVSPTVELTSEINETINSAENEIVENNISQEPIEIEESEEPKEIIEEDVEISKDETKEIVVIGDKFDYYIENSFTNNRFKKASIESYSLLYDNISIDEVSDFVKRYFLDENYTIIKKTNDNVFVLYELYSNYNDAKVATSNVHPRMVNIVKVSQINDLIKPEDIDTPVIVEEIEQKEEPFELVYYQPSKELLNYRVEPEIIEPKNVDIKEETIKLEEINETIESEIVEVKKTKTLSPKKKDSSFKQNVINADNNAYTVTLIKSFPTRVQSFAKENALPQEHLLASNEKVAQLITGVYETRELAVKALDSLSPSLKKNAFLTKLKSFKEKYDLTQSEAIQKTNVVEEKVPEVIMTKESLSGTIVQEDIQIEEPFKLVYYQPPKELLNYKVQPEVIIPERVDIVEETIKVEEVVLDKFKKPEEIKTDIEKENKAETQQQVEEITENKVTQNIETKEENSSKELLIVEEVEVIEPAVKVDTNETFKDKVLNSHDKAYTITLIKSFPKVIKQYKETNSLPKDSMVVSKSNVAQIIYGVYETRDDAAKQLENLDDRYKKNAFLTKLKPLKIKYNVSNGEEIKTKKEDSKEKEEINIEELLINMDVPSTSKEDIKVTPKFNDSFKSKVLEASNSAYTVTLFKSFPKRVQEFIDKTVLPDENLVVNNENVAQVITGVFENREDAIKYLESLDNTMKKNAFITKLSSFKKKYGLNQNSVNNEQKIVLTTQKGIKYLIDNEFTELIKKAPDTHYSIHVDTIEKQMIEKFVKTYFLDENYTALETKSTRAIVLYGLYETKNQADDAITNIIHPNMVNKAKATELKEIR